MKRNNINIGNYKYLIEHFDANVDLLNSQYYGEFVMIRNFSIMNDIICDNDIYIIEKKYFKEYAKELISENKTHGTSLAFPITNIKNNSYSDSYIKFNPNVFNVNLDDNLNSQFCTDEDDPDIGLSVYQLYGIENGKLYNKLIKCDKIKLYHPLNKTNINAIVDISNYINGINFHYLCKPLNTYSTKSETEIKYNNETYSEYIELFFPNLNELFKIDIDGNYEVFYKEDFNIVASTKNKNFINKILSNSADLEESQMVNNVQIVPLNLLIQPYRIVEEYDAYVNSNYNDTVVDDKKNFVKLYLKNNLMNNNNYIYNNINVFIYPYLYIDDQTNMYIYDYNLSIGYVSICNEIKFNLMSRLGFNNGIVSIITLFDYPNKSYFYSKYKNDEDKSPLVEAYKYYNNIDEKYYNLDVNENIQNELEDIDSVNYINDDMINTVKELTNTNYEDKTELLNLWKSLMKDTILKEYEEEFGTPTNFLGFKIKIASDLVFKNVLYEKNIPINLNNLDDFSFQLNNIFNDWSQKPEKLVAIISFYDRVLGFEIDSNLIIITKEWFKYLINDLSTYRLNTLSLINKENNNMNVIDLANNNVNFINTIKCIVHKNDNAKIDVKKSSGQKIIFKPIFYRVNELQSITLRSGVNQNIGLNLSEYLSKVNSFKLILDKKEYIESGRNNIFVIFKINTNDLTETSGKYNLTDDGGNYISSGNWSIE